MNEFITKFNKQQDGAAMLAAALVMMIALIAIGISMSNSGFLEGSMSESQRESQGAYFAAQAGAKDALLKIARDKNASSTGYFLPSDPSDCALYGSTACAKIIIERYGAASACSQTLSADQDCIISTGTFKNKLRKIEVILNVDAVNGKITIVSQKEI